MPKSHLKFHSENGKRLILVVDDEMINRELLGAILSEQYDILYAEDGEQALSVIREHRHSLSLVLLDLLMPRMNGLQLLTILRNEHILDTLPVIVLTSDSSLEVKSLNYGAIDFIPKPYPQADVILARVLRTIELNEDRDIIRSTERDVLTGLYNREYFYRYAEQFDQFHQNLAMDAIMLDINHFHMINERNGKACADRLLQRIAQRLRECVQDDLGIVCRQDADHFLVYCPSGHDYKLMLEQASVSISGEEGDLSRVRLRMGVYQEVDKTIEIERRFDRAKKAADTVRNSITNNIAFYDKKLLDREIYREQLIDDFNDAIREEQFKVYYQPKFDVRPEIPVLSSAEALVRWQHPELGMVSPGEFIPLFEENGLIQRLDAFVWRKAAEQIRLWKERFRFTVPVSVNVSRIDMYDPELVSTFLGILDDNGLAPGDFLLEITESAYTQDSAQMIETVKHLRELGFRIEMDDFGTGYSSLNMISTLPIDALKLDMQFIRTAFSGSKDTRMIEAIIDIASYLAVPVIAEGVETEEQLRALKAMGCDLVQGYYFSRPVPPEEYERFIQERQAFGDDDFVYIPQTSAAKEPSEAFESIAYALSSGFERIYYVDTVSGRYLRFGINGQRENLQIEYSGADFFNDALQALERITYAEDWPLVRASFQKNTLLAQLTGAQHFSVTFRVNQDGSPIFYNIKAVRASEKDARQIVIGISNVNTKLKPEEVTAQAEKLEFFSIVLALSSDFKCVYHVDLSTGNYTEYSPSVQQNGLFVGKAGTGFFDVVAQKLSSESLPEDQEKLMRALQKAALLRLAENKQADTLDYRIQADGQPVYYRMKIVPVESTTGMRAVIGIADVNDQVLRELRYQQELGNARELALRDALTGVKSKLAFANAEEDWNTRIRESLADPFAVAVFDINNLKRINDSQGHLAGDRYIQQASSIICNIFKHSPVFRIGGDEFAAILSGQDYQDRTALFAKLDQVNQSHIPNDGLIIAYGAAEADLSRDADFDTVFERADSAMYEYKTRIKVER